MEHRKIVDANINRVDKKELEGLLNLLATTYVGRKNSLTEAKAAQLKEQFIALLNKKKDSTSKDTYEAMLRLIERFESVLHLPGVMDEIKYGNINSKNFVQKYRKALMGQERQRFDMSHLYDARTISNRPSDPYMPNEKLSLHLDNQFSRTFITRDNRIVIISPVGTLDYQTGIKVVYDYLNLFRVNQETGNPEQKWKEDYIYSKLNLYDMDRDEEFKNAVLEGLLDIENIDRANCGGYVGKVCLHKRADDKDAIHSEKMDGGEYTYRLTDNYVLVYDEVEVTAAMNMPTSQITQSKESKKKDNAKHYMKEYESNKYTNLNTKNRNSEKKSNNSRRDYDTER